MFYCREQELNKLNKRYNDGKFECVVIYGRRRVGKTALINEFCKDKPAIMFSALNSTSSENLEALSKSIYQYKNPDSTGEAAPIYPDYDAALQEITKLAESERLIFVIDEYPYLAKAEKSISSRLQHIIDHIWQQGKLFVILCGSSMSFMEYQVLGYESPLYGRRTAQFKIQALTYKEIVAFNPKLTAEQQSLIYGITGGIPHYINKLNVTDSIDSALLENLFDSSGYLFEEPENLLKQELREPAVYNSIITAIAGGASRANEISTKVGIESAKCAKYINVLLDLGILKRETPITEKEGKKTIYSIGDNFFRFWYRFVLENNALIARGAADLAYNRIKPHLSDYMGKVFEDICTQYLWKLLLTDHSPVQFASLGRWWGNKTKPNSQTEIDIMGVQDRNTALFAECKWTNEKVDLGVLDTLVERSRLFGYRNVQLYLFAKNGFTKGCVERAAEMGNVVLVTYGDMVKNVMC